MPTTCHDTCAGPIASVTSAPGSKPARRAARRSFATSALVSPGRSQRPFTISGASILESAGSATTVKRSRSAPPACGPPAPAAWDCAGCDSGESCPASPPAPGDASVTIQPS